MQLLRNSFWARMHNFLTNFLTNIYFNGIGNGRKIVGTTVVPLFFIHRTASMASLDVRTAFDEAKASVVSMKN